MCDKTQNLNKTKSNFVGEILEDSETFLLDTVVRLEPGVRNVWVLLTPEQPHAHLDHTNTVIKVKHKNSPRRLKPVSLL